MPGAYNVVKGADASALKGTGDVSVTMLITAMMGFVARREIGGDIIIFTFSRRAVSRRYWGWSRWLCHVTSPANARFVAPPNGQNPRVQSARLGDDGRIGIGGYTFMYIRRPLTDVKGGRVEFYMARRWGNLHNFVYFRRRITKNVSADKCAASAYVCVKFRQRLWLITTFAIRKIFLFLLRKKHN